MKKMTTQELSTLMIELLIILSFLLFVLLQSNPTLLANDNLDSSCELSIKLKFYIGGGIKVSLLSLFTLNGSILLQFN